MKTKKSKFNKNENCSMLSYPVNPFVVTQLMFWNLTKLKMFKTVQQKFKLRTFKLERLQKHISFKILKLLLLGIDDNGKR